MDLADEEPDEMEKLTLEAQMRPQAKQAVRVRYTNYRGETADRIIIPRRLRWGSNEWHPEPQWLMDAYDVEKQAERTFAVKDMTSWTPI